MYICKIYKWFFMYNIMISEEQQNIISKIINGENVMVDACAGSGKSTTILSTAIQEPNKKFLLITYNKSLRKEIQEKVIELDIKNITVHTYHSLAVAIYDAEAHVDKVMRLLVQENRSYRRLISTDVIVLDEAQDMTFLYFRLIVKYLNDLNNRIQIMILGDYMQGLYEFKGADIRFLTKAPEIWSGFHLLKSPIFSTCSLKTSYRITKPMADFVNNIMLSEPRLEAVKDGEPVIYIRRKIYILERFIVTTISDLIENQGVKPADIFILGGSVKGSNSLIRKIENALVDANIPCHVPMMENSEQIDDEVIKGKIVFSSFHTSKGRQRPYVFIVGFDNSYFKTIARTLDPLVCPNTLYVATTRASCRLYLMESDEWESDRSLKFLRMSHNEMRSQSYIDFRGVPRIFHSEEVVPLINETKIYKITPTDLTKFISESVLEEITGLLDSLFKKEKDGECLELPTMIKTNAGFYEDVSDLHGIAIPCMLYDYINTLYDNNEECILYRMIKDNLKQIKPNKHIYLKNKELIPICNSVSDYLYMANVYVAVQEKLYFKLKQINRDEYTWLSSTILSKCKIQIENVLQKEIMREKPLMEHVIISYDDECGNDKLNSQLGCKLKDKFVFSGRVDLITKNVLWELKCTTEISAENMIQTVIYAWIVRTLDPQFSKEIKIFNIKTGEVLRLDATIEELTTIVVAILKGKYETKSSATEYDFLTECKENISKNII